MIKLSPTANNTYILLEDYKYLNLVVLKGFETNGADVPFKIFYSIFPPFQPRYMEAIVVHDYLIKEAKKETDRKIRDKRINIANLYFKQMLLEANPSLLNKIVVKLVYYYWNVKKNFIKAENE